MKKTTLLLACLVLFNIQSFSQLYYPATGTGSGASITTGTNNLFFGNNSGNLTTTGNFNHFFGVSAGQSNVSGSGNAFFGNNSGISNTASSNSFFGTFSGFTNSSGTRNVFVGNVSGYTNSTGSYNAFIGSESGLSNTTGESNSFLGYQSGRSNTTGSGNTFLGRETGRTNTTGDFNVFNGAESGFSNSSGYDNTFLGHRAGFSNTSGFSNVYVGKQAGYLGTNASFNTLIGHQAGYNMTGANNVAIGSFSGNTITTGTSNTFVGYLADAGAANLIYSTAIGTLATPSTSNTMALGGTGTSSVGVVINQNARNAIYRLEVNGDAWAAGVWTTSDERFKKNIETYQNALQIIKKIRPVKYLYRNDSYFPQDPEIKLPPVKREFPIEEQIGFIAQELEEIIPSMVRTDKYGFKAVCYDKLFGVIVKGIQEQDEKINISEEKIKTLEAQNKLLTERLDLINTMLFAQQNNKQTIETGKNETEIQETAYIESVNPNPFGSSTNIQYVIPTAFNSARLTIISERGGEVAKIAIKEQGAGNFIFTGDILKAGSFYAYLTVNDVVVDYRKIVLVK